MLFLNVPIGKHPSIFTGITYNVFDPFDGFCFDNFCGGNKYSEPALAPFSNFFPIKHPRASLWLTPSRNTNINYLSVIYFVNLNPQG